MDIPTTNSESTPVNDELYVEALAHGLANNYLMCDKGSTFTREAAQKALEINATLIQKAEAGKITTDDLPRTIRNFKQAREHIESLLAD